MHHHPSYKNTGGVAPGPTNSYADYFRITRASTYSLRDPYVLNEYLKQGFMYIRRLNYEYNKIAREPTVGCYVELTMRRDIGSYPILSQKGLRLIKNNSYF